MSEKKAIDLLKEYIEATRSYVYERKLLDYSKIGSEEKCEAARIKSNECNMALRKKLEANEKELEELREKK